ncbi:hypothetical protein HDU97_010244 [Phlyctochytrium planicorne]|nr:hypothetical protein HDU97_010244 [Phlyctochytrium planicorne]
MEIRRNLLTGLISKYNESGLRSGKLFEEALGDYSKKLGYDYPKCEADSLRSLKETSATKVTVMLLQCAKGLKYGLDAKTLTGILMECFNYEAQDSNPSGPPIVVVEATPYCPSVQTLFDRKEQDRKGKGKGKDLTDPNPNVDSDLEVSCQWEMEEDIRYPSTAAERKAARTAERSAVDEFSFGLELRKFEVTFHFFLLQSSLTHLFHVNTSLLLRALNKKDPPEENQKWALFTSISVSLDDDNAEDGFDCLSNISKAQISGVKICGISMCVKKGDGQPGSRETPRKLQVLFHSGVRDYKFWPFQTYDRGLAKEDEDKAQSICMSLWFLLHPDYLGLWFLRRHGDASITPYHCAKSARFADLQQQDHSSAVTSTESSAKKAMTSIAE